MAAGLALAGMRPVVALYSTFSQRAYDGLVHDVCQNDVPVLLGLDRSGLVGEDGTSHQGMFMLPAMRSLPNLVDRLAEGRAGAARPGRRRRSATPGRWRCSIRGTPARTCPTGRAPLEIGRAEVLRTGVDLLLVGFGPIVQRLLSVASELEADGLAATVINARWAKPMDEALIAEHAAGKRLVVTAEESAAMGGFGDGVLDALNRAGIHVPLHKVALAEGFVHHGAVEDLRASSGSTARGSWPRSARRSALPAKGAARGCRGLGSATSARRPDARPTIAAWRESASTSCSPSEALRVRGPRPRR